MKSERPQVSSKAQGKAPTKSDGVRTLHEKSGSSSDCFEFEHLHTIFQLGKSNKFVITVEINTKCQMKWK